MNEKLHTPKPGENEKLPFGAKFKELLTGVEFAESVEMIEARAALLDALTMKDQGSELLQSVQTEYTNICEQVVDNMSDINPQIRAQLQIAILVHRALIFREIGDVQRYGEDLSDAEDYAHNMYLDEIAEAIGAELDGLAN